jgi:hypothetical protein
MKDLFGFFFTTVKLLKEEAHIVVVVAVHRRKTSQKQAQLGWVVCPSDHLALSMSIEGEGTCPTQTIPMDIACCLLMMHV